MQYDRVFNVLDRYYHAVHLKPHLDMFAARVEARLGALIPTIKYGAVQEVLCFFFTKSVSSKQLTVRDYTVIIGLISVVIGQRYTA